MQEIILRYRLRYIRKAFLVLYDRQEIKGVSAVFQLRCKHLIHLHRTASKGNQGFYHMEIIKGTGHTVFSPDSGDSQGSLGIESAQQGLCRHAPLLAICSQLLEVLLTGKIEGLSVSSYRIDLGNGEKNRIKRG